eukprot:2229339-Pyramimonas_sp.AAC.1
MRSKPHITIINANSFGTLSNYLVDCDSDVVLEQERRACAVKLPEVQGDAQGAAGEARGAWHLATQAGGSEGGVAVLA